MSDAPEFREDATEPVLRLLFQAGIAVTPDVVATNLERVAESPPTRTEVEAALAELDDRNLARTLQGADDYYLATDRGRGYVGNELEHEGFGFVD